MASGTNWMTIGLGVAGLGVLALGAAALLGTDEPAPEESAALGPVLARIDALERRLDGFDKRLRRAEAAPRSAAGAGGPVADALGERIGAVESRLTATETVANEAREGIDVARSAPSDARTAAILKTLTNAQRGRVSADQIPTLQQTAMDRSLSEKERLAALRALRRVPQGRSREVVLAMIDLVRESDDADVRADVFRNLSKVELPELEQPLIDALRSDPAANVREEAAETLDRYLDSRAAVDALRHALEHDEARKVREQAAESLASGERR